MPVALRAACAAALLALGAPAARAAGVPLVGKVVEAYGGKAALARVRAIREQGTVASTSRGGTRGSLQRLFALPDSLRVEIAYPRETPEVRVVHEGKGTRDGADVVGPPLNAMVLQAARMALPLWLAAEPGRARDAGSVERDGKRLAVLAVDLAGGLELLAEVDPQSGRILRTVGVMEGPGGGHFEFVTVYSEFRKVHGILVAFREQSFAGGQQTGDTVLERVEPLATVPPGSFAPGPTTRF